VCWLLSGCYRCNSLYGNNHSFIHLCLCNLFLFFPFFFLLHTPFFTFLILNTVGRTPYTREQPVTRSLPIHRTTQTQNKHRQSCPEWDSNPRLPSIHRVATVIGSNDIYYKQTDKQTPWSESASELHRPRNHRLSAK
jgi:hypothetical protein